MSVKQVSGSLIVKDFTGHSVNEGSNPIAVLLCDLCHALAFREVSADDTIVALIAATLTGRIRVTVVYLRPWPLAPTALFHAGGVGELRTVVDGD